MKEQQLEQLRYPIGKFSNPETIQKSLVDTWITDIENLPKSIEKLVCNLSIEELNLPYRPEGWKIKQVVHHCADSHMNSIIRFKLALTENLPTIKPYYEDRWAELIDSNDESIEDSIIILKGVHSKLGKLLRNLTEADLKRAYIHPEHGKPITLDNAIGQYAWHSNHHLAHIKQALNYRGKF